MNTKVKKSLKVLLIIAILIGIVYSAISLYCFCVGHNVKENVENDTIVSIEYNDKTYYPIEINTEYLHFICDEKIAVKPNFFTRVYYTLKNDPDNNFIYASSFGSSAIFTTSSVMHKDDINSGEITSVLVEQIGWNFEREFSSDKDVVAFLKTLKDYDFSENDEDELVEIKKGYAHYYRVYFSYNNFPICRNDSVYLADYNNEFYLVENNFGVRIDCDKLQNICNSFSKTVS